MKLVLTESQYKRLLTEDTFGRIPNTINEFIVKVFKKLDTLFVNGGNKDTLLKPFLRNDMLLTDKEIVILLNNYWELKGKNYGDLVGSPMEYYGTYKVSTWMPAIIRARTSISGIIKVEAKSKEDAISNIESGEYEEMYPDPDSPANTVSQQKNQMDFDIEDFEVMEDMVLDQRDPFSIEDVTITLDEQDDSSESGDSSGGSSSKWDDMVSPARGVANPIDSSPWDESPSRGVANPLD